MTPGATTAVVVRNTMASGARGGFAAAAGAATGNLLQAVVAGVGVAVVFAAWPIAATVLRLAGGFFLIWLGLKSLTRHSSRLNIPGPGPGAPLARHRTYREGLLLNLMNPAITIFYTAVVPSFMPPAAPRGYYAWLATAHVAIAFACHACWVVAFSVLRRHAEHPAARRLLDLTTGLVLIGVGAQVLFFT